MPHKIISSVVALAFLVTIQSFSNIFRFMLMAMAAYVLVVMAYNFWYLKREKLFTFWTWLRPGIFIASMIGIYFALPGNFLRGTFLIAATFFIWIIESMILVASEQVTFFATLLSFFGLMIWLFGYNYYLLPRNSVILIGTALATFLVARSSFDFIPQPAEKKNYFSWLLALCILETSWALIALPLNYTILGVISFNIFYVLWIIIYYYLFHNLTAKKVSFHILFSSLIILISFLSTPWK